MVQAVPQLMTLEEFLEWYPDWLTDKTQQA